MQMKKGENKQTRREGVGAEEAAKNKIENVHTDRTAALPSFDKTSCS